MSIATIAKALGGAKRNGDGWLCKCPIHTDRTPSLSIRQNHNGELLVHCFTGCDWKAVKDELKARGLMNGFEVKREKKPQLLKPQEQNLAAVRIWTESIPATDTQAQDYLRLRGYRGEIPPSIRFHSRLKHPNGSFYPALVAAVAIHPLSHILSVHRIFLGTDGNKIKNDAKLSLGPVKHGAVRLAPAAETLALTEGIETGLSVMQATGLSVWACLTANGIENVKLPDCVKRVIIFADNDRYSISEGAAHKAARRFVKEGRAGEIRTPPTVGTDYNDYFANKA